MSTAALEGVALKRTADFDETERYRYSLGRFWRSAAFGFGWSSGLSAYGHVLWIMLNPSTADERQDDPTIRRCMSFAHAWGYGGLVVCNIFAHRSTFPRELYVVQDPIGPRNDAAIELEARRAAFIVCAWGNHGAIKDRGKRVHQMLLKEGHLPYHMGLTKEGHPKHPLYLPAILKPQPWSSR